MRRFLLQQAGPDEKGRPWAAFLFVPRRSTTSRSLREQPAGRGARPNAQARAGVA